jgi:hypothetical protein
MTTEARTSGRALQQASNLRLSAPQPEPAKSLEHASIDCLDAMEEATKFFIKQAMQASDETTAKRSARDANRTIRILAQYHPLWYAYRHGVSARTRK